MTLSGSLLTELLHGLDHILLKLIEGTRLTEIDALSRGILCQVLEVESPFTIGQELNG